MSISVIAFLIWNPLSSNNGGMTSGNFRSNYIDCCVLHCPIWYTTPPCKFTSLAKDNGSKDIEREMQVESRWACATQHHIVQQAIIVGFGAKPHSDCIPHRVLIYNIQLLPTANKIVFLWRSTERRKSPNVKTYLILAIRARYRTPPLRRKWLPSRHLTN